MTLHTFDLLQPIKTRLDNIEISNPKQAELLCRLIPASCPFAREIKFFNHVIAQIPPLCKLNPLYEQLMKLRFRALCYLAECEEQITNELTNNALAFIWIK
ncbi:Mo-dependent nitrogenase C-terminal domain-containing protein [Nostoc linckia FACHB-104]|nr:Mo-dependent nitrogenase C-terminal domain-containing protein [Nostoc linckia FACHB-104]